ncbi:MAG: Fe-S cluster assembly sulfur transfer protein SufU [Spirochaetaceae bacterium]
MANKLYKETILSHNRSPAHRYRMEGYTASMEGRNPICGDDIHLYLRVEGDIIQEASFDGNGCSLAIASSDLLCAAITGKTAEEAQSLVDRYFGVIKEGKEENRFTGELEELNALEAVREYPSRLDCACLPWETLNKILSERNTTDGE